MGTAVRARPRAGALVRAAPPPPPARTRRPRPRPRRRRRSKRQEQESFRGEVTWVVMLFVPVTLLEAHLGVREGGMVGADESVLQSGACSLAAPWLVDCEQPHVRD